MRTARTFEALSALFATQPKLLLDRLLQHVDNAALLNIFTYWGGYSASPVDSVDLDQLSEWCQCDLDTRVVFVARFIRFAAATEPGGPLRWTMQAARLFDLTSAPESSPSMWSGWGRTARHQKRWPGFWTTGKRLRARIRRRWPG
jgi:hypothetical protein